MCKTGEIAVIFTIISVCPTALFAATIHVPSEQPTIQSGIDEAVNGDVVIVAPGTYTGDGNRDIDFGGKLIVLMPEDRAAITTIDCQGTEADPHRGFYFHRGEDTTAVIVGFTVRGGYGLFDGPDGWSTGGAILCDSSSSPKIVNCAIEGNTAFNAGGGLCCLDSSTPVIVDCTFENNSVTNDDWVATPGYGGAVRCYQSSPMLRNCTIAGNRADVGGGMSCNESDPVLDNCTFAGNTAIILTGFEPISPGVGGGMHLYCSSPQLMSCVFSGNICENFGVMSAADAVGGAIACFYGAPMLENITFYGNVAESYGSINLGLGGALYCFNADMLIKRSIFAFNAGVQAIYVAYDYCSDTVVIPTLTCCNIYGNDSGDWSGYIADQLGQFGNFSANPLFCDAWNGNLHINSGSPCAERNNVCGKLIGAHLSGCGFVCGDVDGGGWLNILDVSYLINFIYKNGPPPVIPGSDDTDGSGGVNILDATHIIKYLYWNGPLPVCGGR
jgi:parallel beta-helix repeat protein